jgi:hypothetical protein
MLAGISPERKLFARESTTNRAGSPLARSAGIDPFSALSLRDKTSSPEAAANPSGMPPLRVFRERERDSRLESWVAYAGGILPENL